MLVQSTPSSSETTSRIKLTPLRSRQKVIEHLKAAGVRHKSWSFDKTFYPTLDNLSCLPDEPYQVIMGKIKELTANPKILICRVRIGDPGKIKDLSERDFSAIPDSKWVECLSGTTLNLIEIWTKAPLKRVDGKVTAGTATRNLVTMVDVAAFVEKALSELGSGASVEEVFQAVQPFLHLLNVNNILAYLPAGRNGKWIRRICLTNPDFKPLIDTDTRWQDGVTGLLQPQKSVAENRNKKNVFVVDIDDEASFTSQGLAPDQNVLQGYRSKTVKQDGCPREMIYIRLRHHLRPSKIIGIVAIHNFVPALPEGVARLRAKPLLPDASQAPDQRSRIIHQLSTIFTKHMGPYLATALDVTPLPGTMPQRGEESDELADSVSERPSQAITPVYPSPITGETDTFSLDMAPILRRAWFSKYIPQKFLGLVVALLHRGKRRVQSWFSALIPEEETKPIKFHINIQGRSMKIAAYINIPPGMSIDQRQKARWVIIPPAFGKKKETTAYLAHVLQMNGYCVLRYDDPFSHGESEGGIENYHLSACYAAMKAAVDYITLTEGAGNIGLMPFSLSAVPARKLAARDGRIKFLMPVVGAIDVQALLHNVYRMDLIGEYDPETGRWLHGERKGTVEIFGQVVDADGFLGDAWLSKLANEETALEDMSRVRCPVIWFLGGDDPLVEQEQIRKVLFTTAQEGDKRKIVLVPDVPHNFRDREMGQRMVATIAQWLNALSTGQELKSEVVATIGLALPTPEEVAARVAREMANVKSVYEMLKPEAKAEAWGQYLSGYDVLRRVPAYKELLESVLQHLDIRPGENVLDIGCGTGNLLELFYAKLNSHISQPIFDPKRGPSSTNPLKGWGHNICFAVDFVPSALRTTEHKVTLINNKRPGELPRLETQLVNLEQDKLPFAESSMDKIVANLVISYLQNAQQVVRRMYRCLKPGGRIVITSMKPEANLVKIFHNFMEEIDRMSDGPEKEALMTEARSLFGGAAGFIDQTEQDGAFTYFSTNQIAQMLADNGARIEFEGLSFDNEASVVVATKPL